MPELPAITSLQAMEGMATKNATENDFYNKPDPGKLNFIFTQIAADLQRPASR